MLDLIQKCSGYSPLRPTCSQNRTRSNFLHPIQFCSSKDWKKAQIILRKTSPHPIWMACSGFGQANRVWKQARSDLVLAVSVTVRSWPNLSCPEASRCASITGPGSYCAKLAQIWLGSGRFSDCPVLAEPVLSGSKAGAQDSSGSLLANASEPVQSAYWVTTWHFQPVQLSADWCCGDRHIYFSLFSNRPEMSRGLATSQKMLAHVQGNKIPRCWWEPPPPRHEMSSTGNTLTWLEWVCLWPV